MTVADLRARILAAVAKNGGHLASSLGAVEIAVALARVFDPFADRVLWDVGHQAYAWKLLTGRADRFDTLRRLDGISGFQNPGESAADAFVSGHAGVALAAALGMAAARRLRGGSEHVVAVVGDASFANGENLEALELCAARPEKVVVVLNDNGTSPFHAAQTAAAFGLPCIGPVDGHDVAALEAALAEAKNRAGPVLVHAVTQKGRGFGPAERDPAAWHGVGPFDPAANRETPAADGEWPTWSEAFGAALVRLAQCDKRICALTAAMKDGTGLAPFAAAFPERFFDAGIAEECLVTFAAGLAKSGLRPVVALYSTFLQRAVDQIMHDVCLLRLPVVFAIDRAGCVGADGWTHHGMFDLAMLRCLPNLTIAAPGDAAELERMLVLAVETGGPWAIRWPRGAAPEETPSAAEELAVGRARQLSAPDALVQIWAIGDCVAKAREVARLLVDRGLRAGIVDARFVKPLDVALLQRQRAAGQFLVTLENAALTGGFGGAVLEAVGGEVLRFGWPDRFVGHGSTVELEARHGLDAVSIADAIGAALNG